MFKKAIKAETQRPVVSTIVTGVVLAVFVSIICAMIIAYMTVSRTMDEREIGYAVMAGVYLSALVCASVIRAITTNNKAVMSILAVVIYNVFLICAGMLFFESKFQNLIINCAIALAGGVTSIILPLIFSRNPRRIKIRSR